MQDLIANLVPDLDFLLAECSDIERRVGVQPNHHKAITSRLARIHRHSAVPDVFADDVLPLCPDEYGINQV